MRRQLILVLALALLFSGSSMAMPDYLYSVDYARSNAFGLLMATSFGYFSADRVYDNDGDSTKLVDNDAKNTRVLVPVKLGYYLPNPDWSIYALFPIVSQNSIAGTDQVTKHSVGMANPYLVARWTPYLGGGFRMGPRLGVRFSGLSQTIQDTITSNTQIPSGDKSWGFDVAVLCSSRSENSPFRLDAQAGIRYLLDAEYKTYISSLSMTLLDYKETPPATARVELAPGLAWSDNRFVSYVKAYTELDLTKGKHHNNMTGLDSEFEKAQLLGAGVRQGWEIDRSNELGLEFDYDINGKNTYCGWHLSLDYNGYIPM